MQREELGFYEKRAIVGAINTKAIIKGREDGSALQQRGGRSFNDRLMCSVTVDTAPEVKLGIVSDDEIPDVAATEEVCAMEVSAVDTEMEVAASVVLKIKHTNVCYNAGINLLLP
ncbi:unnamed protein product [Cuscuta epithymum]|uniref:Uncharacterized protein n=1 Tax=Cuscuta epithymum TaxID=186058 RepID=A0AAV0DYM6_9ASTE|nr:unnamed protein product [Cuscuta epithymum]CAH9146012.1 unnamed protein product [Cuscuta epithymum]